MGRDSNRRPIKGVTWQAFPARQEMFRQITSIVIKASQNCQLFCRCGRRGDR